MRKTLVLLLTGILISVSGCAILNGKAKPTKMELKYGIGYEDRDNKNSRVTANLGPIVTFDNEHKVSLNYRWRGIDSDDEHGVFLNYSMPIWKAKKEGKWGEGEWISPFN